MRFVRVPEDRDRSRVISGKEGSYLNSMYTYALSMVHCYLNVLV